MKSNLLRGAAICAATAVLFSLPLPAQTPGSRNLVGSVMAGDSAIAGIDVTLHRVTTDASGPVGDAVTDANGLFRFTLPADTATFDVYFATVQYHSVRYLGPLIHNGASVESYTVEVFDTTSALPGAIRVASRDIVLFPEVDGGWEARERILLRNTADRTLVSDRALPTWELRLPRGVTDFQAGEEDLVETDVSLMGDRVLLLASIIPGDRELFLRYRVPISLEQMRLTIDTPTDSFSVFVQQPSPSIEVSGLSTTKVLEVQGERFVQYGSGPLGEGEAVMLAWDAPMTAPIAPELAGAFAALAVLLAGSWIALRNRTPASAAGNRPVAG